MKIAKKNILEFCSNKVLGYNQKIIGGKMNIQKNYYSTNSNPNFTARFPKAELQKVIKDTMMSSDFQERLPRLYTSLEYLDSILPGKELKIKDMWYGSRASEIYPTIFDQNNKTISTGYNALDAIENIFLKRDNKKSDSFLLMPKSVYENAWWKNRNVNVEDIEKFALDVEA